MLIMLFTRGMMFPGMTRGVTSQNMSLERYVSWFGTSSSTSSPMGETRVATIVVSSEPRNTEQYGNIITIGRYVLCRTPSYQHSTGQPKSKRVLLLLAP